MVRGCALSDERAPVHPEPRCPSLRWLSLPPISAPMELDADIGIKVNGEARRVPAGLSVAGMVGALGLDPRKLAVERNHEIVPRAILDEIPVEDGDAFEIVHFVGGG